MNNHTCTHGIDFDKAGVNTARECPQCEYCDTCNKLSVWNGQYCTDCGRIWGTEGHVDNPLPPDAVQDAYGRGYRDAMGHYEQVIAEMRKKLSRILND